MAENEQDDTVSEYSDADEPVYPFDARDKRTYEPLFGKTEESWLPPNYVDAYYSAGRMLIAGINDGTLNDNVEGVVATYLFRHYLELSIKLLLFMGDGINIDGSKVEKDAPAKPRKKHNLGRLWAEAKLAVRPKIKELWDQCDIDFVEQLVSEFGKVDPESFSFRYEDGSDARYKLDFIRSLAVLDHVHNIFHDLTTHMTMIYLNNMGSKGPHWEEFFGYEPGDSFIA